MGDGGVICYNCKLVVTFRIQWFRNKSFIDNNKSIVSVGLVKSRQGELGPMALYTKKLYVKNRRQISYMMYSSSGNMTEKIGDAFSVV